MKEHTGETDLLVITKSILIILVRDICKAQNGDRIGYTVPVHV